MAGDTRYILIKGVSRPHLGEVATAVTGLKSHSIRSLMQGILLCVFIVNRVNSHLTKSRRWRFESHHQLVISVVQQMM